MASATKTSSRFFTVDQHRPLFFTLMSIQAIGIILLAVLHITNPYVPPYEGPVTVTGKKVSGYACTVYYELPTGEKEAYWYGKPGASKCEKVKNGPAISEGIQLKSGTFTD